MKRREFIERLGLAMAASLVASAFPWHKTAEARDTLLHLALLADAHLKDGHEGRAEARRLARAVAEIRALQPKPDLVLFAGDLAHDGDARALALGQEILSDLPAPVLAVRGEGDRGPKRGGIWPRLFADVPFCYAWKGVNLLGLDTAWQETTLGPAFALGEAPRLWLAQVLPRLDPETPLILLSHAPLSEIFRPWGQWTVDAHLLLPLLARFRRVILVHGHVHQALPERANGLPLSPPPLAGGGWGEGDHPSRLGIFAHFSTPTLPHLGEGRGNHPLGGMEILGLPATAWPLPRALEGTPRKLQPGLGPRGCGWVMLTVRGEGWEVQPHSWLA